MLVFWVANEWSKWWYILFFDDKETYYLSLDLRACYLLKCEIERNFPRDERGMQKIPDALKEILKCIKLFKSGS